MAPPSNVATRMARFMSRRQENKVESRLYFPVVTASRGMRKISPVTQGFHWDFLRKCKGA